MSLIDIRGSLVDTNKCAYKLGVQMLDGSRVPTLTEAKIHILKVTPPRLAYHIEDNAAIKFFRNNGKLRNMLFKKAALLLEYDAKLSCGRSVMILITEDLKIVTETIINVV